MDEAKGKPADEQPAYSGPPHLAKHAFKKGVCPNPNGRPKGSVSLVSLLKRRLAERPEDALAIVDNLVEQAMDKDPKALGAIRELWDRHDGTPTKVIEHHVSDSTGKAPVIILNPGNTPVAEEPKEEEADGE